MSPLVWSIIGHGVGVLLLGVVAWIARGRKQLGARALALVHAMASSIDRSKNVVHAEGDVHAARILRDLTRAITGEATGAGLQNFLDDLLKAHGLNQGAKLRDTRRIARPTDG